jgi:hypothetical protein
MFCEVAKETLTNSAEFSKQIWTSTLIYNNFSSTYVEEAKLKANGKPKAKGASMKKQALTLIVTTDVHFLFHQRNQSGGKHK